MAKGVLIKGVKIGTTSYDVTNVNYTDEAKEIDATDTGTTGDGTESIIGRSTRSFSFDMYLDSSEPDPVLKTSQAIELDYNGKKYSGTGKLLTMANKGSWDSINVSSFTGKFDGAVTVTPLAG